MGDDFIPFARPSIGQDEVEAVSEVLRSGWITTGPRAREFEAAFADYVGSKHAVAVCSGTAALHVGLRALGVAPGDAALTSTLTFASTVNTIRHCDGTPLLLDVEADSLDIDPEQVALLLELLDSRDRVRSVESAVKDGALPPGASRATALAGRVKAVVPVHYAGRPCDLERIGEAARKHGALVLEDAAHALESKYRGEKIGSISEATAFSFYATKNITTAEGGMLTTDDEGVAARARALALHGIATPGASGRYTREGSWFYEVVEPGYKYNMTDIEAALGIVQLSRVSEFWERRTMIAGRYLEALAGLPQVDLPWGAPEGEHAWHLFPVRLRTDRLAIGRDRFIGTLRDRGIGTSVHFIPVHLHPYYRRTYGYVPGDFPVAEDFYSRCVSLPLYPALTDGEVERVIATVVAVCGEYAA